MKKGVISLFSLLTGTAVGTYVTRKAIGKREEQTQKTADKYLSLFLLMNQWVKVKQEGKNLASYFEENGYLEIAIYGMGYAGKTLADELANSSVKVKYGIDQNAGVDYERFDIISPEDMIEPVDAIVITPITFLTEIKECLKEKTNCALISLEDVIFRI